MSVIDFKLLPCFKSRIFETISMPNFDLHLCPEMQAVTKMADLTKFRFLPSFLTFSVKYVGEKSPISHYREDFQFYNHPREPRGCQ